MLNKLRINKTGLKIIALISMTVDHFGYLFFPQIYIFRYIGRLAMPLFAYMIAEGCYYTKNRLKYFLSIFLLGLICFLVYLIVIKEIFINIILVFSFSILLIYLYDYIIQLIKNKPNNIIIKFTLSILVFLLIISIALFLANSKILTNNNLKITMDYSIFGILISFMSYLCFKNKWIRIILFSLAVLLSSLYFELYEHSTNGQFYSMITIPILFLYNEKKGKHNLKYFFYLYYPLHLVILYGIEMLINLF